MIEVPVEVSVPLGLDQWEEQKVWRAGFQASSDNAEPWSMRFVSESAAIFWRNVIVSQGGYSPIAPNPYSQTLSEAFAEARASGSLELALWDEVREIWRVAL